MTRAEAVEALRTAGAVLSERGDVADLAYREYIGRARTRQRREGDVFSPGSQCRGKHKYPTEAAARVAAKGGNPDVWPYHCRHCNRWHNGKRPTKG